MKVVITGGAGFLGWRLARRLLARGRLTDTSGTEREISRIVLIDLAPRTQELADPRLSVACGDISEAGFLHQAIDGETCPFGNAAKPDRAGPSRVVAEYRCPFGNPA